MARSRISQAGSANTAISHRAIRAPSAERVPSLAFDALIPWCEDLERQLDPAARLAHWIGHEPDAWQLKAFTTRATEVALRVGVRRAKRPCWPRGR